MASELTGTSRDTLFEKVPDLNCPCTCGVDAFFGHGPHKAAHTQGCPLWGRGKGGCQK